MLRVVLDTTVFCNDFTLSKDSARKLLDAAENERVAIHVSKVVIAETKRRFEEDIQDEGRSLAAKALPFVEGRFGSILDVDVRGSIASAQQAYPDVLDELLLRRGVCVEEYPAATHDEVVQRDLARVLPFSGGKNKPSSGYRDSLIWLTVLEIGARHEDDQIVFVSANSDDYTDSRKKSENSRSNVEPDVSNAETKSPDEYRFATELQSEIANRLGSADRIHLVRDLGDVVNLYLPTTEPITALTASATLDPWSLFQTSVDARAALLEGLFDTAPLVRNLDFARHWNPRTGDIESPAVDVGIPDWFDDAELDLIEGPSDMVIVGIVETQTPGDWIVTTKHLARLTFEGFATKADFYLYDEPDIEVLDADWNERVMRLATQRVVTVTSEVRCTINDNGVVKVEPIQVEIQ